MLCNLHCLVAFRTANVLVNITNLTQQLCPESRGSWVSFVLVLAFGNHRTVFVTLLSQWSHKQGQAYTEYTHL